MGVIVHDFGLHDGVQTYRVSGVKKDLERVLDECYEAKANFDVIPEISHVHRGSWTMLLKIKVGEWRG